MENLEQSLEKVELKRDKEESPEEKPFYKGLRLMDEKFYAGPTSIKYWM